MKKSVVGIIILSVMVLIMGFNYIKDKNTIIAAEEEVERLENMSVEDYMESDEYKNEHQDVNQYLKVSNVKPTRSTGLYNITGQITNTSNVTISSTGELLIFDKQGNFIRSKFLEVSLQPNESMYFDEIVDTKIVGYGVKLQGFEN
jgi:hypothetical protein